MYDTRRLRREVPNHLPTATSYYPSITLTVYTHMHTNVSIFIRSPTIYSTNIASRPNEKKLSVYIVTCDKPQQQRYKIQATNCAIRTQPKLMIHDSDQVLIYHIVPNIALNVNVGVPLSRRHRCWGYPLVLSYYQEARTEALRVWSPNAKLTQFFEDEVLCYI